MKTIEERRNYDKLRKRAYYASHKEHVLKLKYECDNRHREQYTKAHIAYNRNYCKARQQRDVEYRLAILLRKRLYVALKHDFKNGSAVRDLGCSMTEFKNYILSKFQVGMTWDNWSNSGWHLDHIVPLSKFNLQDRQQFLIANNYTNLQPMWAKHNLSKGNFSVEDYRNGMF
jgi:hypothetical protein